MPKKIDPALKERAIRLVREHRAECPSAAKAIEAVARREGVGRESLQDADNTPDPIHSFR